MEILRCQDSNRVLGNTLYYLLVFRQEGVSQRPIINHPAIARGSHLLEKRHGAMGDADAQESV